MADSEQYDSSVSNSLAAQNVNSVDKMASDQKASEAKGAADVARVSKGVAAKTAAKKPDAGGSAASASPAQAKPSGGLVGAVKHLASPSPVAGAPKAVAGATPGADALQAAPMVGGGNTQIPVSSPKGQALTQDPKDNLAAKGRFSEYRKVFSQRGAAGKHAWGTK